MAGAVRSAVVALAVSLAAVAPAWAQDTNSNDDLKKEVETLKKKVAALETEKPAPGQPVSVASDKPEEKTTLADDINKWLKSVNLTGFVDTGYTYNPHNPFAFGNRYRTFDTNPNSFIVNNAQLMLEKIPDPKSIAGFRVKLSMGSDGTVLNNADPTATGGTKIFNLTEAYADVLVPLGKGIDFKVGKFVTNSGYEVIEAKDDFNYSRSLLFTLAIPFTHTGARATYQLIDDKLSVGLGVNNGWDAMEDPNYSKNLEFITSITPIEGLSFGSTILWGQDERQSGTPPPGGGDTGMKRYLIDLVATYKFGDWTFGGNFDYAHDQDAVADTFNTGNAKWAGYAAYVKYQVCKWDAPSIRAEAFRDSDGFRSGTKQTLSELTLTNEFDIGDNLVIRLEYRHDHSSEKVFFRHDNAKYNDDTFAFEFIVKY